MNQQCADLMIKLTSEFYRRLGESFYATRAPSWPGWERLLDAIARSADAPKLVDVAAGNGRFGKALFARAPEAQILELDNYFSDKEENEDAGENIQRHSLDIARALQSEGEFAREVSPAAFDAAVSLAFMHHLPTFEQRKNLLLALLEMVHKKGIVGVSFWQFGYDEKLRAKAKATTEEARASLDLSSFGEDDYLMGWDSSMDVLRYCHHTSDEEIDDLLFQLKDRAELVESYVADGASGRLNRYVILRKR